LAGIREDWQESVKLLEDPRRRVGNGHRSDHLNNVPIAEPDHVEYVHIVEHDVILGAVVTETKDEG
jgi:hypothetical protein